MNSSIPIKNEVLEKLKTQSLGRIIHAYDHLISTNDSAHDLTKGSCQEGETVIADQQSGGKGRLGRSWYSPPGRNLYMSVILQPQLKPAEAPRLTLVAGAAVSDALTQLTGQEIQIKWPNDIIFDRRKLGGILCEADIKGPELQHVIVGIGLNVQIELHEFPEELQDIATSLQAIVKTPVERSDVAAAVLNSLETWYDRLQNGQWDEIVQWCDSHNILKDQAVELSSGSDCFRGQAIGLDEEGHLVLELENGEKRSFLEGDVTVIKKDITAH